VLTATKLTAAQWRVLNWLQDSRVVDRTCNIAEAINQQHVTCEDLVYLEDRRLIEVRLGTLVISFADQYSGRAGVLNATSQTTVRLTRAGVNRVLDDPTNLVIRNLAPHSRGRAIQHVKSETGVTTETLIEMDQAGLIESMEPVIPLADFRKLPGYLKIRLTQKGRAYAPR
jgi:hypothetical protein